MRDNFDWFWQDLQDLHFDWTILIDLDSTIIVPSHSKGEQTLICPISLFGLFHSYLGIFSYFLYVGRISSSISKIFWTSADAGYILVLQSQAWNLGDYYITVGVSPLRILSLINQLLLMRQQRIFPFRSSSKYVLRVWCQITLYVPYHCDSTHVYLCVVLILII